jgi:hypothetical protein
MTGMERKVLCGVRDKQEIIRQKRQPHSTTYHNDFARKSHPGDRNQSSGPCILFKWPYIRQAMEVTQISHSTITYTQWRESKKLAGQNGEDKEGDVY